MLHPEAVVFHVTGEKARSPWMHVTRTTSPTDVISHVTRDGGSAEASASNRMRNVITSRRGASISSTVPSMAGPSLS